MVKRIRANGMQVADHLKNPQVWKWGIGWGQWRRNDSWSLDGVITQRATQVAEAVSCLPQGQV